MSRKIGAFDPASTATTTTVSFSTAANAGIAAVAQNMFPLSTDLSNTGAGDGVLSTLGTVITFSSAVGTPYGAGSAMRIQDSSSTRNKLEISSAAAVQMMEFSSAFTWEWWMWRDSGQNDSGRVLFDSRQDGQHSYPVLLIQFTTGGFLRIANASTGSGSYQARTSPIVSAEQQWQHYAITRDSSDTLRIFLDGVKVLATSFAFSFDNKATGGRPEFFSDVNVTNNAAHYMRDLRIFKATCVYTTSFTVPNQPMTATTETIVIATNTVSDTRTHSHVWNYSDVYDAKFADTWPRNDPFSFFITSTGATAVEPGNGFKYFIFATSGSLTLPAEAAGVSVEYLVVGGGGAGSSDRGAGGGAGGLRTNVSGNPLAGSAMTLPAATYPVVVGPGGTTNTGSWPFDPSIRTSGAVSSFNSIESAGGGRGAAGSGGSGGGGHTTPFPLSQNAGSGNVPPVTPPQGNNGGLGGAYNSGLGGGGGGAGSAGGTGASDGPGAGGNGHPIPAFASPLIAPGIPSDAATAIGPTGLFAGGGGGGGATNGPPSGGAGGPGGGGAGGTASVPPGSPNPNSGEDGPAGAAGVDNTGGGGGGGGNFSGTNPNMRPAGAGGKGVVILRFPTTEKGGG